MTQAVFLPITKDRAGEVNIFQLRSDYHDITYFAERGVLYRTKIFNLDKKKFFELSELDLSMVTGIVHDLEAAAAEIACHSSVPGFSKLDALLQLKNGIRNSK